MVTKKQANLPSMSPTGAARTAVAFVEKRHKRATTLCSLIICTAQPVADKLTSFKQYPLLSFISPTIIVHSAIVAILLLVRPLTERTINVCEITTKRVLFECYARSLIRFSINLIYIGAEYELTRF